MLSASRSWFERLGPALARTSGLGMMWRKEKCVRRRRARFGSLELWKQVMIWSLSSRGSARRGGRFWVGGRAEVAIVGLSDEMR